MRESYGGPVESVNRAAVECAGVEAGQVELATRSAKEAGIANVRLEVAYAPDALLAMARGRGDRVEPVGPEVSMIRLR
jgi:hypothetical protein